MKRQVSVCLGHENRCLQAHPQRTPQSNTEPGAKRVQEQDDSGLQKNRSPKHWLRTVGLSNYGTASLLFCTDEKHPNEKLLHYRRAFWWRQDSRKGVKYPKHDQQRSTGKICLPICTFLGLQSIINSPPTPSHILTVCFGKAEVAYPSNRLWSQNLSYSCKDLSHRSQQV